MVPAPPASDLPSLRLHHPVTRHWSCPGRVPDPELEKTLPWSCSPWKVLQDNAVDDAINLNDWQDLMLDHFNRTVLAAGLVVPVEVGGESWPRL